MLSLESEVVWTVSLWGGCTCVFDKSWRILSVFWIKTVRVFFNICHTNDICTIGIYFQSLFIRNLLNQSTPSFGYDLMKISVSNAIAVRAAQLQEVWHQETDPWWKRLWNCIVDSCGTRLCFMSVKLRDFVHSKNREIIG